MTGRILRIEIHRSVAPWTALGAALVGTALLYVALDGWGGRWMLLALWQREYLFILWPMALGLAHGRLAATAAAAPRNWSRRPPVRGGSGCYRQPRRWRSPGPPATC